MKKYIEFFAKDRLLVNLIFISVFIIGLFASTGIKREDFPQTAIDKMIITIAYPGASPADVELNAVVPVEDELNEINGIDKFTSVSIEGGAQIIVDIDEDVEDKQKVKDEIYRDITIGNIEDLPDEVEDISVVDLNSGLRAILNIGLSVKEKKNSATPAELYKTADILENLIKRVDGVSEIDMYGYLDREIHINVDPEKMDEYYISLAQVVNAIKNRNIRSSSGSIRSVYNEKNIVTIGQFENPADVGKVIIRSGFEQKRVVVDDISAIEDGFEEESVRINVNNNRSVVLQVKKKEAADTIKTVDRIKAFLEENKELYADNFEITFVSDDSKSVSSLIDVVVNNAILGFILVFLILLIFLDLKTSIWTAFSIPFCLLLVMTFLKINSFSLNVITLGAIITVLGMLVDDAIVIAEVIYLKKNSGMPPIEAAISGTREVFSPVLVSILTTIFAFLPILLIKGPMGKFIYIYPVIISVTLLFSLFEAVTILPNHLAHGKQKKTGVESKRQHWFNPVINFYKSLLNRILKLRYVVVIIFLILLAFTVVFSSETIKKFVLFWDDSTEAITVDIDVTTGSSLERTEELTKLVSKELAKQIPEKELVSTFSKIGTHSGHSMEHDYWSTIELHLVPINERERSASDIIEDLRKKVDTGKIHKDILQVILREDKKGPPVGDPVDIKIISKSVSEAKTVMNEIIGILQGIDGVFDIDTDMKKGKKELRFDFNYNKMAELGLDVDTISSTVRTAFEGATATYIQTLENKLDFIVQLDEKFKGDEKYLMNLLIPNDDGRLIRLRDITKFENADGESEINHYNGDRAITVSADIKPDKTTPLAVQKIVEEKFKEISKKFKNSYLIFEGEVKESSETMSDVLKSFIIALFLIYLLIVFLFRSFTQPFIIMCVIPFGLIGVLLAFQLHSIPLSFMGLIGVLGLCGVVVNDSILMIDFINKEKKNSGNSIRSKLFENISEGASRRLRPIIMTTVTTVAGLLPTAYGIGGDAKTLVPVVMAMAYGLLFATVLTLIFLPSLYMINEDIHNFFRNIRSKFM
ncbi:MAG: efflux RND transporter permease subunit [Spirochaetes bacterium]|nr:efflux RND transporter permease subunit [Spirochaetota bacterium]